MAITDKSARLLLGREVAQASARSMAQPGHGILRDASVADCASVVHAFAEELARGRELDPGAVLRLAERLSEKPLQ